MRRTLFEIGLLILLATLAASVSAFYHADKISWSDETLGEGEVLLSTASTWENVLWVDARSRDAYQKEHIPGAIWLSEDDWDEQLGALTAVWKPSRKVVVYCGSERCQLSHEVADRLRKEAAIKEVYVLKNGWMAWKSKADAH